LEHLLHAPFSNFWQKGLRAEPSSTIQSPPFNLNPGKQARQLPLFESNPLHKLLAFKQLRLAAK
jgi:hypothetical protein